MRYTLGQAAKATGKAKSTILRAIKSGTISAPKREGGSYSIDPAELHRVFEPTGPKNDARNDTQPPEEQAEHLPEGVRLRLDYLERDRERDTVERERERDQLQSTIDDLRTRLDRAEDRADRAEERVAGLLSAPTPSRWRWPWKRS